MEAESTLTHSCVVLARCAHSCGTCYVIRYTESRHLATPKQVYKTYRLPHPNQPNFAVFAVSAAFAFLESIAAVINSCALDNHVCSMCDTCLILQTSSNNIKDAVSWCLSNRLATPLSSLSIKLFYCRRIFSG